MKIGFYAGTFDPFTFGHLAVLKKSANFFDKVIVGIGTNSTKKQNFTKNSIKNAIEKVIYDENLKNVEVVTYNNLTCDIAKQYNANYLIKGIWNGIDFNLEENSAIINYDISGLDTIYFRSGKFGSLNSSLIYDFIKNGKDVSKYIPKQIVDSIANQTN